MDWMPDDFEVSTFAAGSGRDNPPEQVVRPLVSLLGEDTIVARHADVTHNDGQTTWVLTIVTPTRLIQSAGCAEDENWSGIWYRDAAQTPRQLADRTVEAPASSVSARAWRLADITMTRVDTVEVHEHGRTRPQAPWQPTHVVVIGGEDLTLSLPSGPHTEYRDRGDALTAAVLRSFHSPHRSPDAMGSK